MLVTSCTKGTVDPRGGPEASHPHVRGLFPRSIFFNHNPTSPTDDASKKTDVANGGVRDAGTHAGTDRVQEDGEGPVALQGGLVAEEEYPEYPSWRDLAEAEGRYDIIEERDYFQPHWTPAVNVY